MRTRVYIAGKLNDPAEQYIRNLHQMICFGILVQEAGFSVFIPGIDVLTGLMSGKMEYDDYFSNSAAWLEVSEAIFLVPGWERSSGSQKEVERANLLGIPIFEQIADLVAWNNERQTK